MMVRRLALRGLLISTLSIVSAYALAFIPGGGGKPATLLMIFGISTMAVSFMTLGAARKERGLGILAAAFAVVFVIITGGFATVLLLPVGESAAAELFLGLPGRAAIVIYGVGILPVFILPVVYATTFEERTLSEDDLDKVRQAAAEYQSSVDNR